MDRIVTTDVDRLSQVFINLIANAVKYSDKSSPRITINCRKLKSSMILTVRDNGPGIPETHRNVIFEKFARLGSGKQASGVGLGLAISKEIMENLGGGLECLASTKGAVFRVTVPLD